MKKAIVLLSGGMDSATCLAFALAGGYSCHALSFNYQQRQQAELTAAKNLAQHFKVEHSILDLPAIQFAKSALVETQTKIPENLSADIPVTYVPARNTIFLSYALALAETKNAEHIFIGVSAVDYSGYPDCRPEYINAFQQMANLATKEAIEGHPITIHTPLIFLSKAQTVELGLQLGLDYRMTVSCYQANEKGLACGKCASCLLRKKGFADANVADMTWYADHDA